LGANPISMLETNFGISRDMIGQLPVKEKGILGRG
jgi:hypothetical protein